MKPILQSPRSRVRKVYAVFKLQKKQILRLNIFNNVWKKLEGS